MITFEKNSRKFGFRTAGIAIHEGYLLLHQGEGEDFWALPGGRVEMDEDARTGLIREMQEELATDITVERLLFVVENFFEYAGKQCHELGMYWLMHLPDDSPLLDKALNLETFDLGMDENSIQITFRWFPMDELDAVQVLPSFLVERIRHLQDGIQYILHYDE